MPKRYKIGIETKIALGYLPLILIMFILVAYPLNNLKKSNELSRTIANNDMAAIELASQMIDDVMAQESNGRKYLILGSNEMHAFFWERSDHFKSLLVELKTLPDQGLLPVAAIEALHEQFNSLYRKRFSETTATPAALLTVNDNQIKAQLDQLVSTIRKMDMQIRLHQRNLLAENEESGNRAIWVTVVLFFSGVVTAGLTASFMTRNITWSIQQLKLSVMEVANGRFDVAPQVRSGDEFEELAAAFTEMANRLSELEEMSLDANPLTRLPGGRAIENVLVKKLESKSPLAFCAIDLDNFKAYNDRYGYSRGNEVIQKTAEIIQTAVKRHGSKEDFIGHIGGDDFTVITSPRCHRAVCQSIISEFDEEIPALYDPEDRQDGSITSKSRQGETLKFPIMTISIAVVTTDSTKSLNHFQIAEIAAELKVHAKSLEGSVFVENRRMTVT